MSLVTWGEPLTSCWMIAFNFTGSVLENEILNNSIISLIRAVGLIARKDLTIHVPVSADITGTISDAINLLTSETAKTLWQVKDISAQVNELADALQNNRAWWCRWLRMNASR